MMGFQLTDESSRFGSSQEVEIANEVHLVVVAGSMSYLGPGHGTILLQGALEAKGVEEASDPNHRLWGHSGELQAFTLELSNAGIEFRGCLPNGVHAAILGEGG